MMRQDAMRKLVRIGLALMAIALPICLGGVARAEDRVERLVRLAVRAQLEGRNDQSLAFYSQALADKSVAANKKATLYTDRGVIYARLGRIKSALEDFNKAIKLYPENPAVYNNRGSTLLSIGYDREAIKDFNRAILLAPGYAAAYLNRGNAHLALKNPAAGLIDYNHAVRLEPGNAVILTARGVAHHRAARPHTAMRDFTHAIAADSQHHAAYAKRAAAKVQLLDYEGAIEDLSRAIVHNSQDPTLYQHRGMAYLFSDAIEEAVRDFTKVLDIKEATPPAYSARGLAYALMEDYDSAMADLTRALELDQRDATSYAYRAFVYRQTEQLALADRDLSAAQRLGPKAPGVLWAAGEIEEAKDKTERAVSYHRSALARAPWFQPSRSSLQRLLDGEPAMPVRDIQNSELGSWRIVMRAGRLSAVSDKLKGLEVPLETIAGLPAKLLDWQPRPPPHARYGILRYRTGSLRSGKTVIAQETAVVIDTHARKVLAMVPHLEGTRKAKWSWGETRLTVAAADGLRDTLELGVRRTSPSFVGSSHRRRVARDANGDPVWAPWAENDGRRYKRRRAKRRRRSKPKSFFDVLFGN